MGRIPLCVVFLGACFFNNDEDGGPGNYTRPDARPDACLRRVCTNEGANCGAIDDGCGGTLECGTCSGLATCGGGGTPNVCAIPAADRVCSDGWCWETPAPFPFSPARTFAVSPTDVWTVGGRGTVMHFDGTHWRTVAAGTTEHLTDIWMASATDGWLVGYGGVVRRWNGTQWNPIASGTTSPLTGVHGTAANNVMIVGHNVTKRWNGSNLLDAAVTPPILNDVFIAGSTVFAVGEGYVWELVTATWTERTGGSPTFTSYSLYSIAGTATNVFALGRSSSFGSGEDLGYQWSGSGWTAFSDPGDPEWEEVFVDGTTIYGASDESIATLPSLQRVQGPDGYMTALAAHSGQIFVGMYPLAGRDQLYTGIANSSTWTPAPSFGNRFGLTRVATVGDSVWATGTNRVVEWNGGPVEHELPVTLDEIFAIGGSSRTDVWLATRWDTYHFDGTSWVEPDDAPPFVRAHAIVMLGAEPALIGEKVYTRANGTWTEHAMEADTLFEAGAAHDGQLYIAGHTRYSPYESRVTRQVNGTWTSLPNPPMQQACGLVVIADNDIWVSGFDAGASFSDPANGIVAHWNGSTWEATTHTGAGELCTLVRHDDELWVTGEEADLWTRSAAGTWTTTSPARVGSIRGLAAQGSTLWAVGDHGAILRRE